MTLAGRIRADLKYRLAGISDKAIPVCFAGVIRIGRLLERLDRIRAQAIAPLIPRLRLWRPVYGPRLLIVAVVLIGAGKANPGAAYQTYDARGPMRVSPARIAVEQLHPAAETATPPAAPESKPAVSISKPAPVAPAAVAEPARDSSPTPNVPTKIVAGWLPFWDMAEGLRVIDEFPDVLTEISPFWYELTPDGGIGNSPGAEDPNALKKMRAHVKMVVPTISCSDGPISDSVLKDPAKRALQISRIVSKTKAFDYDGIDIDYENLPADDRDVFSQFTRELSAALHKEGKKLVVTVNAKTDEPGDWTGAQSHDYAAIGAAADYVRVMAYDQHYAGGAPGPVAGIVWVEQVIKFSLSKIPKEKIVLGIPAYGYDWPSAGRGQSVVHDEAAAKSLANQAPVQWDEGSASSFFTYSDSSGSHTVWFENRRSLEAKVGLALKYDLAGVAIWRLGREDKSAYLSLRSLLSPAP